MKFIWGEILGIYGAIGIEYSTWWGGLFANIIAIGIIILAIIGLGTIIKWARSRNKKENSEYHYFK